MKKKCGWLKSILVSIVVATIMVAIIMVGGEYHLVFAEVNINKQENFEEKIVSEVVSSASGYQAEQQSQQETRTEEPAVHPVAGEQSEEDNAVDALAGNRAYPVSYVWGDASNYTFRVEVTVSNNGSDTSKDVMVSVPLLENDSPYQETTLKNVNYDVVSVSGRVSTFNLGSIEPGESKSLIADFNVNVSPLSIDNTNETFKQARVAYEHFAGNGNCRELARGFIRMCEDMGIKAREVVGFARPERGVMTSGSLAGCRHSWAEFYVEGLGWVPVDLTFQYFAEFPYPSHIVECYEDESIRITHNGGVLSASWSNTVL